MMAVVTGMVTVVLLPAPASGGGGNRFDANPLPGTTAMTHTLYLGEEKVWVHVHSGPQAGLTFVNLHDDENTCVEAAKQYIRDHGGRLVELRHGRGRDVVIRRNGIKHRFDPNRMFSDGGLQKSLAHFENHTRENMALVARFRQQVVDLVGIEQGKAIVAVHNNTEGRLTIHDFKPGGLYGDGTQEVFVSPTEDPDDFFVTNAPALYNALVSLRYNVALMAEKSPTDRGTLARYVHEAGGIYVNIEAQHGHLKKQLLMLENLGPLLEAATNVSRIN